MPMPAIFRTVLRASGPSGVVLLGVASAGALDWQVALAVWAGITAASSGFALWHARDLRRLTGWVGALREGGGEAGARPEVQAGDLLDLARQLGQLEQKMGRMRAGAAGRDRFISGLLQAIPMPVLALTADGRVTRANAAAAALFGKPPTGHTLPELTRMPACLQAFEAAGRAGAPQTTACSLPGHDDTLYQVHVHPFEAASGEPPQRIMLCHGLADSTPRETARAAFLANASHEFRTPLTAILGMVETLLGPARDDPEVQKLYLERLGRQASRMVTLVDDMIHLSAVEMSEAVPPEGEVDLVALAREVGEDLAWQAAARSIDVRVEVPEEPVVVTGDAEQLRQLLTNLLSNAVQHGNERGFACVAVHAKPARLTVTDNGDGIPPTETDRVFERFYRSAQARNRRIPGHGLGLAIVKHVARRHGATLGVESEPGVGCAISVTFADPARSPMLDATVT